MPDRSYTYEGSKDGITWGGTVAHLDHIFDDITGELDRAEPGTEVTFTVKVGEGE